MSHPYRAQSRFPYRPARLSAPTLAPMGLGDYSRGSFSPRLEYATPHYAAGYPGLNGFGQEMTAEQAQGVLKIGSMIIGNDPSYRTFGSCITEADWATVMKLITAPLPTDIAGVNVREEAGKALMPVLKKHANDFFRLIGKGRNALTDLITSLLEDALGSTLTALIKAGLSATGKALHAYVDKSAAELDNRFAQRAAEIVACLALPEPVPTYTEPTYVPTYEEPTPLQARTYAFDPNYKPQASTSTGGGLTKVLPIAAAGVAALLLLK